MLTTADRIEAERRLAAAKLIVPADEYVENVLHNDFWDYVGAGREAKAFARGELDYSVTVDVTNNVPDLGPNPWFCIGGDEPREVYMLCVGTEEILGRTILSFEARFSNDLPERKVKVAA